MWKLGIEIDRKDRTGMIYHGYIESEYGVFEVANYMSESVALNELDLLVKKYNALSKEKSLREVRGNHVARESLVAA